MYRRFAFSLRPTVFIGVGLFGRWWKIRRHASNPPLYSDRHDPTAIGWRGLGLRITGLARKEA